MVGKMAADLEDEEDHRHRAAAHDHDLAVTGRPIMRLGPECGRHVCQVDVLRRTG